MQAKPRVAVSRGVLQVLEDFNLGARQDLGEFDKRQSCCRNAQGDILEEMYADPCGDRTSFLFPGKPVRNKRARQEISDPGSRFDGWNNKCLMNAVLSCVSGQTYSVVEATFQNACTNHLGAGLCGNVAEAINFLVVQQALRDSDIHVRVWGASSLRSFERGDISSRGLLGSSRGACVGHLLWCEETTHVYVCTEPDDFEPNIYVTDVPWKRCVVGGQGDAEGTHANDDATREFVQDISELPLVEDMPTSADSAVDDLTFPLASQTRSLPMCVSVSYFV